MILIPMLVPALMGLMMVIVLMAWLSVVLFGALASALACTGASLICALGRRRSGSRQEALAGVVALPTAVVEYEDWPEAA
jgi:hypothetical protein